MSTGHFYILTVVNNAAMNMGVQISVQDPAFSYFVYIMKSRIDGSCGIIFLIILRNYHTFFQRGCTIHILPAVHISQILHIHTSSFLRLGGHFFVLIVAMLMETRWYLVVVLIDISLVIRAS